MKSETPDEYRRRLDARYQGAIDRGLESAAEARGRETGELLVALLTGSRFNRRLVDDDPSEAYRAELEVHYSTTFLEALVPGAGSALERIRQQWQDRPTADH